MKFWTYRLLTPAVWEVLIDTVNTFDDPFDDMPCLNDTCTMSDSFGVYVITIPDEKYQKKKRKKNEEKIVNR